MSYSVRCFKGDLSCYAVNNALHCSRNLTLTQHKLRCIFFEWPVRLKYAKDNFGTNCQRNNLLRKFVDWEIVMEIQFSR